MFSHQLFRGDEAFSEGTCSATHALSSESACNTCLKMQRLSDLVDPFPHPVEKERKKSRRQEMEQHGQHKYRYQRRQWRDYQKGFAFGVPTMFPRFQTSSGFSHPPNPDQSCFWQPRVFLACCFCRQRCTSTWCALRTVDVGFSLCTFRETRNAQIISLPSTNLKIFVCVSVCAGVLRTKNNLCTTSNNISWSTAQLLLHCVLERNEKPGNRIAK